MMLEELIAKIENVSKSEVKKAAPSDARDIHQIIMESVPRGPHDKMVLGYLTSLCAERMYPGTFELDVNGLDYIGFELEKGIIAVEVAGDNLGSCMRHGKIIAKKVGDETGSSMVGGEIDADEINSIGNTLGGKINVKKVHTISKDQGAEIFIKGVKFKRGFLDRLLGR
ncbi:MAG: hypothetical protein KKG76_06425 [Euryarchaeota archaeon]|nr:hypothetical protein [Euryarchaeota archaeon]MBU4139445.1 hypothetical protein [Euryarchaeota archaeon]